MRSGMRRHFPNHCLRRTSGMSESNSTLTQDQLRQVLFYDPETGVFVRRKNSRGRRKSIIAGCKPSNASHGYIRITINKKRYMAHRLAWLYVNGRFPEKEIDHINGIRHDNRICNLREASTMENAFNRKTPSSNQSGFRGVSWDKVKAMWLAVCKVQGTHFFLGYFEKKIDAAKAYQSFASEKHGLFFRPGIL